MLPERIYWWPLIYPTTNKAGGPTFPQPELQEYLLDIIKSSIQNVLPIFENDDNKQNTLVYFQKSVPQKLKWAVNILYQLGRRDKCHVFMVLCLVHVIALLSLYELFVRVCFPHQIIMSLKKNKEEGVLQERLRRAIPHVTSSDKGKSFPCLHSPASPSQWQHTMNVRVLPLFRPPHLPERQVHYANRGRNCCAVQRAWSQLLVIFCRLIKLELEK